MRNTSIGGLVMDKIRILELEDTIKDYSTQYYLGEAAITDAEFDKIVDELRELDPTNELLTSTGWGMIMEKVSNKANHYYEMKGLPKVRSGEEDVISAYTKDDSLVTMKMDGCAVEIIFNQGKVPQVITRGNGLVGQDVTDKFTSMWDNVDLELTYESGIKSLTAEVCMSNEDRELGTTTHTRNIVAGMLSRKEVNPQEFKDKTKLLIHGTVARVSVGATVDAMYDRETLKELGFELVPLVTDRDTKVIDAVGSTVIDIDGKTYSVDGLVISPGTMKYIDGKLLPESLAVKTNNESVETVVTGIDWNISRTGTFVPLVRFEPITLNGATVRKASGSSLSNLKDKGIGIGSVVRVIRSGEIIPYIDEVLTTSEDIQYPELCPHCNRPTKMEGARLVCSAPELCSGVGRLQIIHFILTMVDTDNIGAYVIDKILRENPEVRTIEDLYTIEVSEYADRQDRSATDMLAFQLLEGLWVDVELGRLLIGLGIPSLGWGSYEKYGKSLYDYLRYQGDYVLDGSLERPKGVRKQAHQYILDNRRKLADLVQLTYAQYEYPEEATHEGPRLKVCITGSLDKYSSRSQVFKEYPQLEEVNIKHAEYLVTNSSKMTSKYKYASANGIKIITESELYSLLDN